MNEPTDSPKPILTDGNDGRALRLLDPNSCFFVEHRTGDIDVVPKDRVSNLFRRDGLNFRYYDRGADQPPVDARSYVKIEELEALVEEVTEDQREAARMALGEPRTAAQQAPRHYTDLAPPPEGLEAPAQPEVPEGEVNAASETATAPLGLPE